MSNIVIRQIEETEVIEVKRQIEVIKVIRQIRQIRHIQMIRQIQTHVIRQICRYIHVNYIMIKQFLMWCLHISLLTTYVIHQLEQPKNQ